MSKPTKKELEQQREQIASKLPELEKQQQVLQGSIDELKKNKLDTTNLEQTLAKVESDIAQARKDLDEIDAKLATLALDADSNDEDSDTPKPDDQDAPGATKKMPPAKPKSGAKKFSLWFWLALILAILTLGATVAQALMAGSPLPATTVWDTAESTATGDPASDATDSTTSSEPVSEDVVREAQTRMTVDLNEVQVNQFDSVVNGDWSLLWYSLSTYDGIRTSENGISDAVSVQFTSSDQDVIYNELQQEILRNPVYGIGMLDFLRGIQVGDQTIGDLNPWIDEVIAKNDGNGEGCNNWVQYAADNTTIEVTPEYRIYASGICTLLDRMVCEGTGEFKTTENWCLNLALLNTGRRMVKCSYEYQGDFIVYTYFGKDGEGLLRIGFNLRDKRPALLTELEEATPVTPDTTDPIDPPYVPPNPPTPPDPPVPPTPPDPPVPPTPPDPPDPGDDDPTKDPTKDPDAQGNADKGGGVNDDPGPGKYEDQHESTSTGSSSVTGNNDSAGNSTTGPVGGSSTDTGSTPPATDPIPPVDSSTGTDNATGESGNTANDENTGTIVMPD